MSSAGEASTSAHRAANDAEPSTSSRTRPQKVTFKEEESEIQKLNDILLQEGIKMRKLMSSSMSIPQFNKPKLVQNCIKWMTICCNVDDYYEIPMALKNMKVLIKQSAEYRELNGSVTYFLKTKFFAKFFRYYTTFEEGWKCAELCAMYYKTACGVYHDRLRDAAAALFEKKIVCRAVIRVYAVLPMTGDSGTDGILHSTKWNIQFEETVKKCNAILRDLLKDVTESQPQGDGLLDDKYCSSGVSPDEELLYVLFCNYCNVLRYMLLTAFPATKILMPQQVFNVICRCLNVTSTTLGGSDTTRKIKLRELLPKFHIVAHILLKSLILTCKTHLLPYSFLITKVIYQTIQLTDVNLTSECNEMSLMLRISAYDNWIKWALASNGAGTLLSCDIASSALSDLTIPSFNEKSEEDNECFGRDKGDPDIIIRIHPLRKMLGIIGIKVLTVYTRVLGGTLTAEQLKEMEAFVVDRILKIHHSITLDFPYSSPKYRHGLYSLLLELVNTRSSVWASPVNWSLELFRQGVYDNDCKVSNFCSSALPAVQNIIDQEIIRQTIAEIPFVEESQYVEPELLISSNHSADMKPIQMLRETRDEKLESQVR